MAMLEISIVPLGTGTPSVSRFVANAVGLLRQEKDTKYELTAMGTIIEGETGRLLEIAGRMHRSAFDLGARRVVTTIKLDERRDKPQSIEGKVKAVKDKIK